MEERLVTRLAILTLILLLATTSLRPTSPPGRSTGSAVRALGASHAPIRIVGNSQFTSANGVVSGQGTAAKPYLIQGWSIDASTANGVDVQDTTAFFVLDHIQVCCGGSTYTGISFSNVSHATVLAADVTTSLVGLHVDQSSYVNAFGGNFSASSNATEVWASGYVNVSEANLTSRSSLGISAKSDYQLDLWSDIVYTPDGGGLVLSGSSYVRVVNDSLDGYGTAILVPDFVTRVLFAKNSLTSWSASGLLLTRASYVTVRESVMGGERGYSLYVGQGNDVLVENNTLYGSVYPEMFFSFVRNLTVSGNTGQGAAAYILDLDNTGPNVSVRGNRFTGSFNGILLDRAYGTIVQANRFDGLGIRISGTDLDSYRNLTITPDNLVSGLPILYSRDCGSVAYDRVAVGEIIAANCTSLSVSNMSFASGTVAIQAAYVGSVSMYNVSISLQNDSGFLFYRVGRASVEDGSFFWNRQGVNTTDVGILSLANSTFVWPGHGLLANDGGVDLRNVTFYGLPFGAILTGLTGGTIQDCRFFDTGYNEAGSGVALAAISSANVTVVNSTFAGNMYGVNLVGDRGFLLYGNTFQNGFRDAYDDNPGMNAWNASYPFGGNNWTLYRDWDDCHGPLQDNCTAGDGFGDVPYTVPYTNIVDHYPLLSVNPPKVPPVVQLSADRTDVTTGDVVTFTVNAYDPLGWPLFREVLDFGDGTNVSGVFSSQSHAYAAAGTYTVRLTVESLRHLTSSTSLVIAVLAPVPLALVRYQSPRGYVVPVPLNWSRTYNLVSGSYTYELLLQGSVEGQPASMIVDTEPYSGIEETDAYLTSLVQQVMLSLQKDLTDAYIVGQLRIIPLSGHLAATFEVGYSDHPEVQFVLIVVSQAHEREWEAVLTGPATAERSLNVTFDEIVQGFIITIVAPAPLPVITVTLELLGIGVGFVVPLTLVVAYLVWRRRRHPRHGSGGACAHCGTVRVLGALYCVQCGAPFDVESAPSTAEPRR